LGCELPRERGVEADGDERSGVLPDGQSLQALRSVTAA